MIVLADRLSHSTVLLTAWFARCRHSLTHVSVQVMLFEQMASVGELGEAEDPQPAGFSAAAFGGPELTEQAEAMQAAMQVEVMQVEAMQQAEAMQQELEALAANDPMLTVTAESRLLVTMSADSTQIER